MKTHLTFTLFVFACSFAHAQSYTWSHSLGNTEFDTESRIAVDHESNMYATGTFKGTLDFDPGPGNATLTSGGAGSLSNAYITKFDSTGNFLWVKQLTGDIQQYGRDIVFDAAGFIYVFGYYIGTCDFDPGPDVHNLTTPNFTFDSFLLKLDADGNFVWAVPVGENGNEYARRLTIDKEGNVIMSGIFTGTSDFDPGPNQSTFTVMGMDDIFMVKYSSEGDFVWARHLAGNFNSDATGIDTDSEGNIYLSGVFDDHRDFDPGPDTMFISATGLWDIFTLKLSPTGNLQWVRHLGNNDDNWAQDLILDDQGHIFITGYFSGALDFDPGPESDIHAAVLSDIFVWKLNLDGEFVWAKPIGGISYEQGRAISLDRLGDLYVTGFYAETVDFDPGPGEFKLTSTGNNDENDAFALKLHADGSFVWAHTLGGLDQDTGFGVEIGGADDIFLTGTYAATAGFNPGSGLADSLVSKGSADVYFARWKQCLETYGELTPFSCGDYVSPSGQYTWTESGTYLDTIKNVAGCDSIMTIHLSISDLGLSITQSGNDLIGDGGAKQFFWLDCDHNGEVVGQGSVFTPAMNGNYALVGSGFVCTDTTACFSFVMTGTSDLNSTNGILIYPNPASNSFVIDLKQSFAQIKLSMFDAFGRKVYEQKFSGLKTIPVKADLPAGLYLLLVNADGHTQVRKVLMQ